jgi:hypothetical protein
MSLNNENRHLYDGIPWNDGSASTGVALRFLAVTFLYSIIHYPIGPPQQSTFNYQSVRPKTCCVRCGGLNRPGQSARPPHSSPTKQNTPLEPTLTITRCKTRTNDRLRRKNAVASCLWFRVAGVLGDCFDNGDTCSSLIRGVSRLRRLIPINIFRGTVIILERRYNYL